MNASVSFQKYETRTWEGEIEVFTKQGEPEPSPDLLADSIKNQLGVDWTAHVTVMEVRRISLKELGRSVTYRLSVTVHGSGNASGLDLEMHRRMHAPDPQEYSREHDFKTAERNWLIDGIY